MVACMSRVCWFMSCSLAFEDVVTSGVDRGRVARHPPVRERPGSSARSLLVGGSVEREQAVSDRGPSTHRDEATDQRPFAPDTGPRQATGYSAPRNPDGGCYRGFTARFTGGQPHRRLLR